MTSDYLPAWATLAEACEWLQAATGEPWPVARLLAAPVNLAIWLEPGDDLAPEVLDGLFAGRHEGFMAPLIFGGDSERLAFERSGGAMSVTTSPRGHTVRITPAVKFAADELRVSDRSLREVADAIRAGRGTPEIGRLNLNFGGVNVATKDPHLLAMLRTHGAAILDGASVELLRFEQSENKPPLKAEEGGKKWTPERIAQARAMLARLKREKVRDYAAQTAKALGVTPARLRQVLGPDDTRPRPPTLPDWPPTSNRKHRAK